VIDFLSDPSKLVADLADVSLDHTLHDRLVRQHLGHTVLHTSHGWALLLVAYRTWGEGGWGHPEYRLTRWRRLHGTWRHHDRFQIRPSHIAAIAALGQDFTDAIEAAVPPEERTRVKIRESIESYRARKADSSPGDGGGTEPPPVTQT